MTPSQEGSIHKSDGAMPLPDHAVKLSGHMVLEMNTQKLNNWQRKSEVWALTVGPGLLSGAATVSGVIANEKMRKLFNLGNIGRMTSFLPVTVIPSLFALAFNQQLINSRMLMDRPECPVCLEITSVGVQTVIGVVQPWLLAFVSSCHLARLRHTHTVPKVTEVSKLVQLFIEKTGKGSKQLMALTALNVLVASVVTIYEGKQAVRIWQTW